MIQVRKSVFETNSSSTHSLTFCTGEDLKNWKEGKIYFIPDSETFITEEEYKQYSEDDLDKMYGYARPLTLKEFEYGEWCSYEYECFTQAYKTPKGEEVAVIVYHGYNG